MKCLPSLFIITILSTSLNSFAGSTSHGPNGKGYEVSGCNGIGNIVKNIQEYSVSEKSDDIDSISICEENNYSSQNRLDTLEQIAQRAKEANCFETTIDHSSKTISIKFLEGIKTVVNVSNTVETYTMKGYDPVVKKRTREKIYNYCVIHEESIEGSLQKVLEQK